MKGLATLAELFTVLAILFLVQTVLNFAATTQSPSEAITRHIVLTVSQVPSGNIYVDHLRYLQIGKHLLEFKSGGCRYDSIYNSISPVNRKSVYLNGRCTEPPKSLMRVKTQDDFISDVLEDYSVRVSISSGRLATIDAKSPGGTQHFPRQITVSYATKDLQDKGDVSVAVGYCLCELNHTPANTKSLPLWGLGSAPLPYPHPLVVRIITLEAQIETARDLTFFHDKMQALDGEDIIQTDTGLVELSTLFQESNCPGASGLNKAVFSSGETAVRQYSISLRNL